MKMRHVLTLSLGCAGLFLLYKVEQGQEKKPKADLSHAFYFNFDQQELRKLIQESWYAIVKSLVEKDFLEKDESGDYINRPGKNLSEAQDMVTELVSSVVDKELQKRGSLAIQGLEKHILGENSLNLFGVSLKRMLFSSIMEVYGPKSVFSWCGCVPHAERITVAMNVVNDVSKSYLPKNQLTYTAIATGSLLQDYIILQELKARGFKSIKINIVDPAYFSPADLKKLKDAVRLSDRENQHIDYLAAFQRMEQEQDGESKEWVSFVDSLALEEFIRRLKEDGSAIEVVAWENTYDYIARAKQYPAERSDIVLLIDAAGGYFEQPNYPSLANVVLIAPKGQESPQVRIYLSEHNPAELYVCDESEKESALYKQVAKIIAFFSDKTRGKLVVELLKKFGDKNKFTMSYAVDLYALLQDMMYECLTDPKKAVVYADDVDDDCESVSDDSSLSVDEEDDCAERVIKIDPLAYQKKDVRKDHAHKQCGYEEMIAEQDVQDQIENVANQAQWAAEQEVNSTKNETAEVKGTPEYEAEWARYEAAEKARLNYEAEQAKVQDAAEVATLAKLNEDFSTTLARIKAEKSEPRKKYEVGKIE